MAHDYLIIGAGPAGLQLAALAERDGRDYAVLERGPAPGTFFTRFPRHRTLISINKVHSGYADPEQRMRMDWNSLLSDDPELLFVVLAAGWFTDYIGVFSVFGGFVTGLAMPQSPVVRRELETRLTDLNSILLLPVFFAFTGLNTQVDGFGSGGALWLPLAVIMAAAFAGKYLGCAGVVRLQGFSWRYASAVGGLMNARGLMILIFINIGLAHDMVTPELFAILVLVAIVTTAAAMPIYRASLPDGMDQADVRTASAAPVPARSK